MAGSQSHSLRGLLLKCPCQKSDFAGYYSDEECLGFFCKSCWKEWLLETYISATRDPIVTYNGRRYLSPIRCELVESELCPVTTSREEINPKYVAESVKPGDHIMWHRPYFIWHHAIVEDVNDTMLTLIHFQKESGHIAIRRETTDATKQLGTLYLVSYSNQVKEYNPPELVLARARALIGMDGFNILKKNCENFATFSKSGLNTNQQGEWFKNKLREICTSIGQNFNAKALTSFMKIGAAEMVELGAEEMKFVTSSAELVGAGVIIAFEAGICIWNLGKLYQKYITVPKDGRKSLSRKDFIEQMVEQISQRFFAAAGGVGGGIALTALGTLICPGLGTVGGAVLGIIGGCTGATLGHILGVTLGQFVSHAIAKTIMTDDRAVLVQDLQPGDHIVLYGNVLHPRCHAIFVRDCSELNKIMVIRHTYESGIILDSVDYSACDPIFRLSYAISLEAYSSEDIIKRAVKAVADYDASRPNYNILTNNCKHFVYSITLKGDSLLKHFPP